MAKKLYVHADYLLTTKRAEKLYHRFAEDLPIIDYHCHLPPAQIAEDRRFRNLTELWLSGDHYKWRAMRSNGVEERYCTGDATDYEKFQKWSETVPALAGNQLYGWTHLELARYFGVTDLLCPKTAKKTWDTCNKILAMPGFSARGLMKRSGVALVCTTDDPTDSLEHHKAVARDKSFKTRVLPTWRPDKARAVENPVVFNQWVNKLSAAADVDVRDWDSWIKALRKRHDFFHACGCRLSDHAMDVVRFEDFTEREVKATFRSLRDGRKMDPDTIVRFKSVMMCEFAEMDAEKGWVQQYHLGALRNVNSMMFEKLGPDTGYDVMCDAEVIGPLARLLDRLEKAGILPKTIVYNLHPKDNEALVSLIGAFQGHGIPGRMQYGSAWWQLDHKDGMEKQLRDLQNIGLLSRFVGMLTDSRSFVSYPRHEYFRRVLCNMLGRQMKEGHLPDDMDLIGGMVRDICFNNAKAYFGFGM